MGATRGDATARGESTALGDLAATVNQDLRFCNHHMATYATWQWKHRRALKQSEVMT
jgi:hypothetical protein